MKRLICLVALCFVGCAGGYDYGDTGRQPRYYIDTSTGDPYMRYNSGTYVGGNTVLRPFGPNGDYVGDNGVYYQKFGHGLINTESGEFLPSFGGE